MLPHTLKNLPSFYFYVDEFQNFANESFSDILSEARKYKLRLLLRTNMLSRWRRKCAMPSLATWALRWPFVLGRLTQRCSRLFSRRNLMATDLVNFGFAQIYLTLMIDGVGSPPFSATTLRRLTRHHKNLLTL
jgi:hypothetical protein